VDGFGIGCYRQRTHSIQNREAVDVSVLAGTMSMPKIFLILGTYILGMLSGWGLLEALKRVFRAESISGRTRSLRIEQSLTVAIAALNQACR
jgi:hypothetical protein